MPDLLDCISAGSFGASIMALLECAESLRRYKRIPVWLKVLTLLGIATYASTQGWLSHA